MSNHLRAKQNTKILPTKIYWITVGHTGNKISRDAREQNSSQGTKFCAVYTYLFHKTSSQFQTQPDNFKAGQPVWSHLEVMNGVLTYMYTCSTRRFQKLNPSELSYTCSYSKGQSDMAEKDWWHITLHSSSPQKYANTCTCRLMIHILEYINNTNNRYSMLINT